MFEDDYSPFDDRHPFERVTDDQSMQRRRIQVARDMRWMWQELTDARVRNEVEPTPVAEPFPILQEQYINKDSFNEYLYRLWKKANFSVSGGGETTTEIIPYTFDTATPGYNEQAPFFGTYAEYLASSGGAPVSTVTMLAAAFDASVTPETRYAGGRPYLLVRSDHNPDDPADDLYGWTPYRSELYIEYKQLLAELGDWSGETKIESWTWDVVTGNKAFSDLNDGSLMHTLTANDTWKNYTISVTPYEYVLSPSVTSVYASCSFRIGYDYHAVIPPYYPGGGGHSWLYWGVNIRPWYLQGGGSPFHAAKMFWRLGDAPTVDFATPRMILNNFSTLDMDSVDRWLEKMHAQIERELR